MINLKDWRGHLWQWDTNQVIEVDVSAPELHFRVNSTTALKVEIVDMKAQIPDVLLQKPGTLICYLYDGDATLHSWKIDVWQRPKPPDYIYTPEEKLTWEQLDERIKALEAEEIQPISNMRLEEILK